MKPVVIIPALNPDEKLLLLIKELTLYGFPVLIVNDGSKRRCDTIFQLISREYGCTVCSHSVNQGKGAAIKTAIAYVMENFPKAPGIITADADGQHTATDIRKVADSMVHHQESLILGVRDFTKKGIPLRSRIGNQLTSFVFRSAMGIRCMDTQTGLRGIPMNYLPACLTVTGDRYEYETNLLLEFAGKDVPVWQVPIQTIYLEHNRSSHFHPVKDSMRIYLNLLKYGLSSVLASLVDVTLFSVFSLFIFASFSHSLLIATVLARLFSGAVNFTLNKHWVFRSMQKTGSQAIRYGMLFTAQMALNWVLVVLLVQWSVPLLAAKILVNMALFFISYSVQKNKIFKSKKEGYLLS
ncbi:bifunctional glycosyltransferase family 2/GtrA family protein [Planomicrobium sp. CPCC 101079]|uniref:bifunctional glycosyltransferase family 2/GtrA family protein n=1 Tax=Planomicrobium sp. CPCC 101079 TaxID=2599618 RepID=UPI0011B6094A|nr:bifunctional glycosyltransferase family 2/GtrA family protein [Planomicrobium sp. CPCC 101079]TWT01879.1 glycosyltransferase [Planomicrobium sp. CPCC 101079]